MVTISGYKHRKSQDGTQFIVLELQGGVEMVQSSTSGRWRAVVRRASIPANFDEATAKSFIGSQIPGRIVRIEADEPYTITDDSTGEMITLTHTWSYQPEEATAAIPTADMALV